MDDDTAELPWSPEDRHANRPVALGSDKAREMTAGSGRKLSALLIKRRRIDCCSKILLESSTWTSTEYFLNWKGSATRSKRSIYRLAPWTRRNSGTESGSSDSWPTLHGTAKEEYDRRQGPTGNELGNLCNKTWPTTDASEAGKTSRSGDRKDEMLIGGIVRATWPVVRARDQKDACEGDGEWTFQRKDGKSRFDQLPHLARATTWATPNNSVNSGGASKTPRTGHTVELHDQLYQAGQTTFGCLALMDTFVERLTNLSLWLMGYTAQYFRHWETRSYRKSRSGSSAR